MSSSKHKSVLMIWPGVKRLDDPLTPVVMDHCRLPYLVWVSWFDNLTSSHATWHHGLTYLCQSVLPLRHPSWLEVGCRLRFVLFLSNLGSSQGLLRYFVTSSPLLSYTSLVNFQSAVCTSVFSTTPFCLYVHMLYVSSSILYSLLQTSVLGTMKPTYAWCLSHMLLVQWWLNGRLGASSLRISSYRGTGVPVRYCFTYV
jgi:hypothetical protein